MTNKKQPTRRVDSSRLFQARTQRADDTDLDFLLTGEPQEVVKRAAEHGFPLRDLAVTAVAPDPEQLRHLPHPDELVRLAEAGNRPAAALLAELRELGASLTTHGQIQPAIVYPDRDANDPKITHRLIHGQRRWSGALLTGVPTLWAVEVPKPAEALRIARQYEENERHKRLSDMERAWALDALKAALEAEAGAPIPWSVVEAQLQISEPNRKNLRRLLRFDAEGQAFILRYGWSEWLLRPLHQALEAGEMTQEAATQVLSELTQRDEVSLAVVADLVAAKAPTFRGEQEATPDLAQQLRHPPSTPIAQIQQRLDRLAVRAKTLDSRARAAWLADIEQIMNSLEALLTMLRDASDEQAH
jgi:hypothetical protein